MVKSSDMNTIRVVVAVPRGHWGNAAGVRYAGHTASMNGRL